MKHMTSNFGPSVEDMVRLAIKSDFSCDISDPRNGRYLVPLSNAELEGLAYEVASRSYSAASDVKQCLVNIRRMLCDPDYMRLFCEDPADY
jgi:hypothetical protein